MGKRPTTAGSTKAMVKLFLTPFGSAILPQLPAWMAMAGFLAGCERDDPACPTAASAWPGPQVSLERFCGNAALAKCKPAWHVLPAGNARRLTVAASAIARTQLGKRDRHGESN